MQRVVETIENQKPTQKLRLKSKVDLIKFKILYIKTIFYMVHIKIFAGVIKVQQNPEPYISRSF